MAKYTKLFQTESEYNAFKASQEYVEPNVSYVEQIQTVHYNPLWIPPTLSIGDVCYYNTSEQHLKFCSLSEYNSANGPVVGLVVVPNNCTPDGTVRIMSVKGCTSGGTTAATDKSMTWGLSGTDTGFPNLDKVPTWSNSEGSTYGNGGYGFAPSDKFNQTACYGNNNVFYYGSTPYIPPILNEDGTPNQDCLVEILSGDINANALCDFDGAGNTAALVALGSDYVAASACSVYSLDGLTSGWYLPACGELVYILPKFTVLQSALSAVGGTSLGASYYYWSSSECNSSNARPVYTGTGTVYGNYKNRSYYVRPFASVALSPLCF